MFCTQIDKNVSLKAASRKSELVQPFSHFRAAKQAEGDTGNPFLCYKT
jgi:hypothetical protein